MHFNLHCNKHKNPEILQFIATETAFVFHANILFSKEHTQKEKRERGRERKYTPKMEKAVEHAEPHIYIGNRKLQNSFNGI